MEQKRREKVKGKARIYFALLYKKMNDSQNKHIILKAA